MESYSVEQGTALPVHVTLVDGDENPIAYAGSEVLASVLQAGPDRPALGTPPTAWVDAAAGLFGVTLSAAFTAALTPGTYLLRTSLAVGGGDPVKVYEAAVVVEAGPASAVVMPVYTTYARVLELAPWVESCYDPRRHLSGFLRERATARKTFDTLVLRLYRGDTYGDFGPAPPASPWRWGGGPRRGLLPSPTLTAYLAANKLIVTDQVDRINAWLAVAEVGRQQIGLNNAHAAYGSAAAEFASAEISVCTATVDLNNDGIGELAIPLGASNPVFT